MTKGEKMKTAGVVIDDWKLAIFTKHLKKAGYEFEKSAGISTGTYLLKVKVDSVAGFRPIVKAANEEARKLKNRSKKKRK